jgi:hypothetical protein
MSARRASGRGPFLLAALACFARPLEAGTPIPHRPVNPHDRAVVRRLTARAAARLDQPECGKLLKDFKDRSGRTLAENLQPAGISPSAYLLRLTFVDGSRLPNCGARSVAMATIPGVPRVFLCPDGVGRLNSRLARIAAESASLAEAMVIHEMLHTLGLGENPPSTFEITDRVRYRCR